MTRMYPLIVLLLTPCNGFTVNNFLLSLEKRRSQVQLVLGSSSSSSKDENKDPDLFDYFDPLRSPHDYPEGIGPDHKPHDHKKDDNDVKPNFPAGLDLLAGELPSAFVDPAPALEEQQQETAPVKKKFATDKDHNKGNNDEEVDLFDVFDPTLSPHSYPNGIPSTTKRTTVGILLMDHGSRNPASNQRLHQLAKLYQESLPADAAVIVKAAHMEIASPSIPEVLAELVHEHKVDEIVCHPYFLSPGRHVQEDIPQILEAAVKAFKIDIPVVTTPPVGSNTEVMIQAIHATVQQSSTTLSVRSSKMDISSGGGGGGSGKLGF